MNHKTLKEAASQEAYLIHRMTDCGQDAAQNFMDTNPGLNIKKLTNDLMYNLVNRFEVRDVITGRAHEIIVKKFMKAYNTMAEAVNLNASELSSDEYQQAKKLKAFNASDYKWDSAKQLYSKTKGDTITNDYIVKWVDHNYKSQSKIFKNNPSGAPDNAFKLANKFKDSLEAKHKADPRGKYRNIEVEPLKESFSNNESDKHIQAAANIISKDPNLVKAAQLSRADFIDAIKRYLWLGKDQNIARTAEALISNMHASMRYTKQDNLDKVIEKLKEMTESKLTEASIDLYQELEPTLNDLYSKLNAIIKSTVDPKYKQAIQNLLNAYEAIENKMSQVTSKMGVVPVMEVKRFSDPTYPRDVVNTNGNIVTTREGKKYKVLTTKPKEGSKDFYFDTLMDRVEQLNPEDWDIDVRTYKKAIPVGTNEESKLKESHKLLTKLIRDAVEQAVTETADANDYVDYNSTIHKKLETGAADFELDPTNTIVYAFMPFEEEANVHVRVPFKKEYIEGFTEETISSQADLDRLSYDIGNYVRSVMRRPDKDQILKKVLKLN